MRVELTNQSLFRVDNGFDANFEISSQFDFVENIKITITIGEMNVQPDEIPRTVDIKQFLN